MVEHFWYREDVEGLGYLIPRLLLCGIYPLRVFCLRYVWFIFLYLWVKKKSKNKETE